jgi:hypothetical protein
LAARHSAPRAHAHRQAKKSAAAIRAQLDASANGSGPALNAPDKAVLEGRLKTQEALSAGSGK